MTDAWGDPDPDRTWRPGVGTPPPAAGTPAAGQAPEWSYFPPDDQQPRSWSPVARVPVAEAARAHAVTFVTTAAVALLLGSPLALLWRAAATPAVVVPTAAGPQPVAPETDQVFAVDGWFVVVSLLAGVVAGVVAWLVLRDRGPSGPIGLAVGGTGAAAVAAAVGRRLVVDRYLYDYCHAPDIGCIVYDGTLRLNAGPSAFVALPAAMLLAFAVLSLVFDRGR